MLMNERHAALMVKVLYKEYPEIASMITERIKNSLPEQSLTDLQHIEQIVSSFKRAKGIDEDYWTRDHRETITAIVLLFYHPEKLMQLTSEYTRSGVSKTLSAKVGSSREVLSLTVASAIVAFKAYEDFRNEVYRLYELIKIENEFFK